jgi:hypothetical protein
LSKKHRTANLVKVTPEAERIAKAGQVLKMDDGEASVEIDEMAGRPQGMLLIGNG